MSFCDRIAAALKFNIGVYNLEGVLVEGTDNGFIMVDDNKVQDGKTCIRVKNAVIIVDGALSEDAQGLIKITYDMSNEKAAADFMQPLEYIIKNDVKSENIKGKYLGCHAFYIKCSIDIVDILRDIYEGFSYDTVIDEEGIYLVKQMEEAQQEAEAIINGISLEKGINVIIGAGHRISGNYTVKDSAEHAKTACSLAQVMGFNEGYYHIDKMIMYGLIYSIEKDKIEYYINGGYAGFTDVVRDKELIDTAEELFRCHLNISEAARRLYLHRNTLLYRIEKIKNLTGIDIKKFEEAVIFRIIISIYKLKGM